MGLELSWFWFWVILAAVLIVGEIFTAGFFLLPFGIGSIASAVVAWFGGSEAWQWIVFLVVSIPALLLVKRFAERMTVDSAQLKVAADRALGQIGIVLEPVKPHGGGGRVRVGREEWRAEPETNVEIPEGAEIEVLKVDGTHLVVRPHVGDAPRGGSGGA